MIHYEIIAMDRELGVIVRATDDETGATGIGASDPVNPEEWQD